MTVIDVDLSDESRTRYLTYALSVVSSRALPDVRDGLKPVQRRILYAMLSDLNLSPERHHRKSAAVVGEVLARYHPHGDTACYEAMVRMAQDFSMRYPLVDGQGNFGSLDGDSPAAYRYTEARLTSMALEVIGDIGQDTIAERDNFDQTVLEPVVLPSRLPNLLLNGCAGIAVGMATAIPPHNLQEVVKALLLILEEPEVPDAKIFSAIKGPDFPTGCEILNSKAELKEIYSNGRGAIRMRGAYRTEQIKSGRSSKEAIIVTSVPYGQDKSVLVEKIADLIVSRKVPQLDDVRDESTDEVRIVLELTNGADSEAAMAYLYKHTPLQQNFYLNFTALVPTRNELVGRPAQLSLRQILEHFLSFRLEVVQRKLRYEKSKLDERIHLLQGLLTVMDSIEEVIRIVRKSEGRSDAAEKLMVRFKLSQAQALFIVDLRVYQLSRTNVDEVRGELEEKEARVAQIERILGSEALLRREISKDLERLVEEYGDARKSPIISDYEEPEFDAEQYVQHEEVHVIVSADGWLKRIRANNDPHGTRVREGDRIFFTEQASTRDVLLLFTSAGNVFGLQVMDIPATNGYGDPVQKLFSFDDGEQVVACVLRRQEQGITQGQLFPVTEVLYFTEQGMGYRGDISTLGLTTKKGKRVMRIEAGDRLLGVVPVQEKILFLLSEQGYGLCYLIDEVPLLGSAGKGVILQKLPEDDRLRVACTVGKKGRVMVSVTQGKPREVEISALTLAKRAQRGNKLVQRAGLVIGLS